jgi:hypothetical protein
MLFSDTDAAWILKNKDDYLVTTAPYAIKENNVAVAAKDGSTTTYAFLQNGKDKIKVDMTHFDAYDSLYYLQDTNNLSIYTSPGLFAGTTNSFTDKAIIVNPQEKGEYIQMKDRVYIRSEPTKESNYYSFFSEDRKTVSPFLSDFPKESYALRVLCKTETLEIIDGKQGCWYLSMISPPFSNSALGRPVKIGKQVEAAKFVGTDSHLPFYGWVFSAFVSLSKYPVSSK